MRSGRSHLCQNSGLRYVLGDSIRQGYFPLHFKQDLQTWGYVRRVCANYGVCWEKVRTLVTIESRWRWHRLVRGGSAWGGRNDHLLLLRENSRNAVPLRNGCLKFIWVTANRCKKKFFKNCSTREKIVWRTSSVIFELWLSSKTLSCNYVQAVLTSLQGGALMEGCTSSL